MMQFRSHTIASGDAVARHVSINAHWAVVAVENSDSWKVVALRLGRDETPVTVILASAFLRTCTIRDVSLSSDDRVAVALEGEEVQLVSVRGARGARLPEARAARWIGSSAAHYSLAALRKGTVHLHSAPAWGQTELFHARKEREIALFDASSSGVVAAVSGMELWVLHRRGQGFVHTVKALEDATYSALSAGSTFVALGFTAASCAGVDVFDLQGGIAGRRVVASGVPVALETFGKRVLVAVTGVDRSAGVFGFTVTSDENIRVASGGTLNKNWPPGCLCLRESSWAFARKAVGASAGQPVIVLEHAQLAN
ncbi:MAG: hypothetical protein CMI16_12790 [Opitutaceae bacterium]|nr:hypothetical protein [Opitutaceae bacterium]